MPTKVKRCSKCGKEKSISEFGKRKSSSDGRRGECKLCLNKYGVEYHLNNNYHINGEKIRKRNSNPHRTRAQSSYYSHKQRGMNLQLSVVDIEEIFSSIDICPICGKKMIVEYGNGHNRLSPSLDRINNDIILTKDNTWVICNRCNTMKADLTLEQYVEHCKLVYKKFRRD